MTDTKYTPPLDYTVKDEYSPSKEFSVATPNGRLRVYFDERDLKLTTENTEDNTEITQLLGDRLWVPGLQRFKKGVFFRIIFTDEVCLFQLPEFVNKWSHLIIIKSGHVVHLMEDTFFFLAESISNQVLMHDEIIAQNNSLEDYKEYVTSLESDVDYYKEEHSEAISKQVLLQGENNSLKKWKDHATDLEKQIASYKQKLAEKEEFISDLPRNTLFQMWTESSCSDFIIKSPTCEIPVHKAILARFWPFFKTMLEIDCKEVNENVMSLDFPPEVIEVFLSDIYGKKVHAEELTFDKATKLMEMAGMYQMPHLADVAYEKVLLSEPELKMADCVNGWKSARMGDHGEAKKFFSGKIVEKMKKEEEGERDDFEEIDREELLELFMESLKMG